MLLTSAIAVALNPSLVSSRIRSGAARSMGLGSMMRKTMASTEPMFAHKNKNPLRSVWGASSKVMGAVTAATMGPAKAGGEPDSETDSQGRGLLGDVTDLVSPSAQELSARSGAMNALGLIIAIIIFVIYYIGLCTFWSRANPDAPLGLRIFAYLFLLVFGELYMIYVVFRFAFFGISRREDKGYASLHKPARYFGSASRV